MANNLKRPLDSSAVQLYNKKPKVHSSLVLSSERKRGDLVIAQQGPARTSGLLAPTMKLTGHQNQVNCVKFNPAGDALATGSKDKLVLLWQVYGECENFGVLKGHKGAILDLAWGRDGEHVFTASADKFGGVWDANTCTRIKKLRDHSSFVNSINPARRGEPLLVTGSDDCTALLWDLRVRASQQVYKSKFQTLSVCLSDDSTQLFTAGIDHDIFCWDLRMARVVYSLEGHDDSVTSISLSPDGSYLLSNSMDQTLRSWDVRPYIANTEKRAVSVFRGHSHDFQKNLLKCAWSGDGSRVSGGSADRFVYVWDTDTQKNLYKLPGHEGSVNEVAFHPVEPIVASASSDKAVYMGEILGM